MLPGVKNIFVDDVESERVRVVIHIDTSKCVQTFGSSSVHDLSNRNNSNSSELLISTNSSFTVFHILINSALTSDSMTQVDQVDFHAFINQYSFVVTCRFVSKKSYTHVMFVTVYSSTREFTNLEATDQFRLHQIDFLRAKASKQAPLYVGN